MKSFVNFLLLVCAAVGATATHLLRGQNKIERKLGSGSSETQVVQQDMEDDYIAYADGMVDKEDKSDPRYSTAKVYEACGDLAGNDIWTNSIVQADVCSFGPVVGSLCFKDENCGGGSLKCGTGSNDKGKRDVSVLKHPAWRGVPFRFLVYSVDFLDVNVCFDPDADSGSDAIDRNGGGGGGSGGSVPPCTSGCSVCYEQHACKVDTQCAGGSTCVRDQALDPARGFCGDAGGNKKIALGGCCSSNAQDCVNSYCNYEGNNVENTTMPYFPKGLPTGRCLPEDNTGQIGG